MYSMPKIVLGSVSNICKWFELSNELFADEGCFVAENMLPSEFLPKELSVFNEVFIEW